MMPPNIPRNLDPDATRYLRDFSLWVKDELNRMVPKEEAVGSVLLASPAGKVYSVAVDDTGLVTSTLVSG